METLLNLKEKLKDFENLNLEDSQTFFPQ